MQSLFEKIKNSKLIKFLGIGLFSVAIIAGLIVYFKHEQRENRLLNMRLSSLENQIKILASSLEQAKLLNTSSSEQIKEIRNRQDVAVKSQDGGLVLAVSQVSPAVVSIVISKDVPKLKITYQNPFGDDSFFQGLNIKVPVYEQVGTTTEKVGAGTGFFIRSDGYIITNRHVVSDLRAGYTALLSSGVQKPAKVVYRDPNKDIAVIKVDGSGYPIAKLGDSSKLQLGETVAAIGNALGEYNNSVSVGVVSGVNRTVQAYNERGNVEELKEVIQTDAAINLGNSGGPLLNLNGEVVGVNVATVIGSNSIGFSIPINDVKKIIAEKVF